MLSKVKAAQSVSRRHYQSVESTGELPCSKRPLAAPKWNCVPKRAAPKLCSSKGKYPTLHRAQRRFIYRTMHVVNESEVESSFKLLQRQFYSQCSCTGPRALIGWDDSRAPSISDAEFRMVCPAARAAACRGQCYREEIQRADARLASP